MHTTKLIIGAVVLAAGLVSTAQAQSGAALMIKPWTQDSAAELTTGGFYQFESHTRDGRDDDFSLQRFDATGRFRFDVTDPHSPAIGFDVTHYNIDTINPSLPDELTDQSVAVGFGLAKFDDWEVGMTVGAGYAGNNPYGDANGVYATANLIASRKLSETEHLQVLLNYHGNRTIFPDLPLPGIAYTREVSDTFTFTLGAPFSSIAWRPIERGLIKVTYSFPYTFEVVGEYEVVENVTAFAGFHNDFSAYHIDGADGDRRLFFRQRRIEAGARWQPCEMFNLELAGGYSFSQEFNTGWDARDLDNDLEISNAPYVRLGVDVKF